MRTSDPDSSLMRCVQAGQPGRFAELIHRYEGALLRVAHSRLGRRDWAEEAVQEAFLAAFKSRASYKPAQNFRTWLWTILLNQCRAQAERRGRVPRVSCWSDVPEGDQQASRPEHWVAGGEPLPLARLLDQERRALLESLLARLSPAQADALRLRFYGGLKFQEIAETMGCSLGTAKNRVKWGLLRLSQWLGDTEATQSETGSVEHRIDNRPSAQSAFGGSPGEGAGG